MTQNQIIIGLLILLSMAIRPFLYKPCAKYFPAELSAAFTSIWLLIGFILSLPFCGSWLKNDFSLFFTSPYFVFSILKGIFLWIVVKLQQVINKESTSSSVFSGFIAMALGSLINNLFFNEGLQILHLLCISALGVLGVFFVRQGDAKRLSHKEKIAFLIVVIFSAMFSVLDHVTIPQIGWYPYLLFSSLSMFFVCFFYGISKQNYYDIFRNKNIIIAGIVYTSSEFLIIYSSINIMPVSYVAVFMRMSIPIVMLLSSVLYHEQSLKNQFIFSILAISFALPLLFL